MNDGTPTVINQTLHVAVVGLLHLILAFTFQPGKLAVFVHVLAVSSVHSRGANETQMRRATKSPGLASVREFKAA